jgi:hypothetical protein
MLGGEWLNRAIQNASHKISLRLGLLAKPSQDGKGAKELDQHERD